MQAAIQFTSKESSLLQENSGM